MYAVTLRSSVTHFLGYTYSYDLRTSTHHCVRSFALKTYIIACQRLLSICYTHCSLAHARHATHEFVRMSYEVRIIGNFFQCIFGRADLRIELRIADARSPHRALHRILIARVRVPSRAAAERVHTKADAYLDQLTRREFAFVQYPQVWAHGYLLPPAWTMPLVAHEDNIVAAAQLACSVLSNHGTHSATRRPGIHICMCVLLGEQFLVSSASRPTARQLENLLKRAKRRGETWPRFADQYLMDVLMERGCCRVDARGWLY